MKIIGHDLIDFSPFIFCKNMDEISQNKDKNVIFDFDAKLIKFCSQNGVKFGVCVSEIKEILLANAANAATIIVPKNLAENAAKIAQNYLFDAQIAVVIQNENELEKLCDNGVDMAIFRQGIKNGNF